MPDITLTVNDVTRTPLLYVPRNDFELNAPKRSRLGKAQRAHANKGA